MKHKYYFERSDSEICYSVDHFKDIMKYDKIDELEVYEAIPEIFKDIFWCKVECFCGDDSKDSCGKQCKSYNPRNGKSGCCKNFTHHLFAHGEKTVLKLK